VGSRGFARRRIVVALTLGLIAGALVAQIGPSTAGVLPGRQILTVDKLCPPALSNPTLKIANVSNASGATPQTINYTITRGNANAAPVLYTGTLAPGHEIYVKLAGTWTGTYFAHFNAIFGGKAKSFDVAQYCACETATTSTTVAPTTATTVPPTTATTVPPTTATTVAPTTSTTTEPATSTTTGPTTSTTVPPTTATSIAGTSTSLAATTTTTVGAPKTGTLPQTGAGRLLLVLGVMILVAGLTFLVMGRLDPDRTRTDS